MGCDIHMCLEYKTFKGEWRNCNLYEKDRYEGGYSMVSFTRHRSYDLFAALCGVRNAYDVEPISQPKGLPDDISDDTKGYLVGYWGDGGHSHSWNTLRELIEYDHKPVTRKGMISKEQYEDLQNGKKPTSWCQWTNAKDHVHVEWLDDEIVNPLVYLIDKIKTFSYDNYIIFNEEEMKDKLRIVYCFDS
jgi:hypothetical protein